MMLQYLKTVKHKSIHYKGENKLIGHSDADYANDEDIKISTIGYIFLLGKSPIIWKSQIQKIVTLLTAEAEFISLTECPKQRIWLKNLIEEITKHKLKIKINDG